MYLMVHEQPLGIRSRKLSHYKANEMDKEMKQNIGYRGSRRYGQGHIPIDLSMAELDDLPGREPTSNKSCSKSKS